MIPKNHKITILATLGASIRNCEQKMHTITDPELRKFWSECLHEELEAYKWASKQLTDEATAALKTA